MPKAKTRKGITKRFKVTPTGKILRGRQYGRHRIAHKSRSQKSRIGTTTTVAKGFEKVILTYSEH